MTTKPVQKSPVPELGFAPREVRVESRSDGTLILSSPIPFQKANWSVVDLLPLWSEKSPDQTFLAQRGPDGQWVRATYRSVWQRVQAVAQGLIDIGAKPGDNLAILSGNSIEHAIVMFAAMAIGVVVAPVSPNYSLMPGGLSRLHDIGEILQPSFVFAQDSKAYSGARSVAGFAGATWITVDGGSGSIALDTLETTVPSMAVSQARAAIDLDAPAKILFTSGSTGLPKGVINTHRMMACALDMGALLVPPRHAPVQVEWLPWHHTMGSNVILHGILKHGGSLYIDDGRPMPHLFHKTIANLKDVSPTGMFNVPAGYVLLCSALETDADLRSSFFRHIDRISYAGSAITRATLDKLYQLSVEVTGRRIPVMSGYGTTETAPTIATTHWATDQPGEIGLPAPGLELKLLPAADGYEVRVRGPNVTPGYLNRPDLTSAAFDEEGFYRIGDTIAFIDHQKPQLGLRFTGRLSENFKLSNGTWVVAGNLRATLLNRAQGVLQDLVIAGENRDTCAILGWINPAVAKDHAADAAVELHRDHGVLEFLRHCLQAHNASIGSSERVCALLLLDEPPSLAAGEITDKAYVNQRAVLNARASRVDQLYSLPPEYPVISI